MIVGLGVTLYYMVGSRFFGVSWFGTTTVASGVFGIPLGFLTIWIVSLLTHAPEKEMQDLVTEIRYPRSGGGVPGRVVAGPDLESGGAEGAAPPPAPHPDGFTPGQDAHDAPAPGLHGGPCTWGSAGWPSGTSGSRTAR